MKTLIVLIVMVAVWTGADNREAVTAFQVLPSATDPEIKTFDSPHYLYINREIVVDHQPTLPADRHQLLLWLTGTGGKGAGARAFCSLAADSGYHVVSLMYPDDIPATVCRNDSDPGAFEAFRMAIIQGGKTPHISIAPSESIEHRLVALLRFIRTRRPREDWGQFLTADGQIRWDTIAVAGQSQGGGHAALMGIKHPLARVICTGAPKDFSKRLKSPAAWYAAKSATPRRRFFVFNHRQDPKGCSPAEQLENVKALGLDAFGPPVDVATERFPYHHSHTLLTSYPNVVVTGPNSEGASTAHVSVIANFNAERWKEVWTYMLTEKVQ